MSHHHRAYLVLLSVLFVLFITTLHQCAASVGSVHSARQCESTDGVGSASVLQIACSRPGQMIQLERAVYRPAAADECEPLQQAHSVHQSAYQDSPACSHAIDARRLFERFCPPGSNECEIPVADVDAIRMLCIQTVQLLEVEYKCTVQQEKMFSKMGLTATATGTDRLTLQCQEDESLYLHRGALLYQAHEGEPVSTLDISDHLLALCTGHAECVEGPARITAQRLFGLTAAADNGASVLALTASYSCSKAPPLTTTSTAAGGSAHLFCGEGHLLSVESAEVVDEDGTVISRVASYVNHHCSHSPVCTELFVADKYPEIIEFPAARLVITYACKIDEQTVQRGAPAPQRRPLISLSGDGTWTGYRGRNWSL